MIPLFIFTAVLYAAASFTYGLEAASTRRRVAYRLLWSAVAAHFATIGAQCLVGAHPFRSIYLVMSAGTWGAALTYSIFAMVRAPVRGVAGLLAPLGLLGLTLGVVMGPGQESGQGSEGLLLSVHIGLATIGLMGFVLASAVAGLYLGLDFRLRRRRAMVHHAGHSLQNLESMLYGLMALVAPVFALAIVTGLVVLGRVEAGEETARRGVELVAAGVALLASLAVLVSRVAWGLRGRKSAAVTLVGLVAVIIILVSYGVRA